VADDDTVSSNLTVRVLQNCGFDVRAVADGQAALDELLRAIPDLIVTDLVMPKLDGMELLRVVRSDPRWHHIPVIAMSASASHYTQEQAIESGCTAFVAKPVRLTALFDAIEGALSLKWQRVAASPQVTTVSSPTLSAGTIDATAAQELHELARMGDINALMQRASELLGGRETQTLLDELRSLAERYDTGAIRRLLGERLPHAP
jgi:CheY-like chemotaxis protein